MFSTDLLKTMTASVVTQFINQGVSLNDGIVKAARENSLNLAQTDRLIESANQVTYLKLLEKSADRTFQFPLAERDVIRASLLIPEDHEKSASVYDETLSILAGPGMQKAASAAPVAEGFDFGSIDQWPRHVQIKIAMDWNEKLRRDRDVLAHEMLAMRDTIEKSAAEIRRDPWLQDKLASYTGLGKDYLVGLLAEEGHSKSAGRVPFRVNEFKPLAQLGLLLVKAAELVERSNLVAECLDKMAGLVSANGIASLVKADLRSPLSPGYRTAISHPAPTHMAQPQGAIGPGIWNGRSTAPGDGPTLRGSVRKASPGRAQPSAAFRKQAEIPPEGTAKATMTAAQRWSDRARRFKASPVGRLAKKPSIQGAMDKAEPLFFREQIAPSEHVYSSLHGD